MPAPILEVRDLKKFYGPTAALDGVSFRVEEGELFGLLGPNGAGKTTLLSIVACLSDPDAGEAFLFGRPLDRRDRSLRRQIGVGTQDLAVYGELTARENLRFVGKLYGLRGGELARRVDEVLAAVGLTENADQRAGTFSGGMKRRLNLGVAIVHEPRLLLLDEPTTGVDPQSRNHIFEQVRSLNAAGVTVIYTSHYMEEVQALCRRIGILDHGKLIACDALEALLHTLPGSIRLRVAGGAAAVRGRVAVLPGVEVTAARGETLELQCTDVPRALLAVVAILNELNVELLGLETHEPDLERVFLHLTGRALRD